jgi:2-polyprenyl-3-methyl-5-hydroxy-6-metoxy-1,4-benzoquinol methylase
MNKDTLEKVASLLDTHLDFDGVLAHFTALKFQDWIQNKTVLEAGCSTGVITEYLLEPSKFLDVLEGSHTYADLVSNKFGSKIRNVFVSFFEDFKTIEKYDVVLYGNVLHHLEHPQEQLELSKSWISHTGVIIITVPNMSSFHRRLGVEAGMLKDTFQTTERNSFFVQPGRYDKQKLEDLVLNAGFEIIESSAFFLKPFNHEIMQSLNLNEDQLNGLNKMGVQFQDLASQLFIVIKKK